jgi:hypothetical protein
MLNYTNNQIAIKMCSKDKLFPFYALKFPNQPT